VKNNNCFSCLNHLEKEGVLAENTGWYHPCKFGIKNDGMNDIEKCEKYEPNQGFQMGGYYTHMHFEADPVYEISMDGEGQTNCLEWFIHGDGQFPSTDPEKWLNIHICDFRQIEEWVKFWGKELRRRGWISKDTEEG